jgi:hypothetical protein
VMAIYHTLASGNCRAPQATSCGETAGLPGIAIISTLGTSLPRPTTRSRPGAYEVKLRRKASRKSSEQLDHLLRIREKLQERLAKLLGGVAIIKVGGRPRRK